MVGRSETGFSEADTICWTSDDDFWADPDKNPPGSRFAAASFVQARFAGDARFDSAQFAGSLDLQKATFATLYLPSNSDPRAESELLPRGIGLVGVTTNRSASNIRSICCSMIERNCACWKGMTGSPSHSSRRRSVERVTTR